MVRKKADELLILLSCALMIFSLYQLYFRPYQLTDMSTRVAVAKISNPTNTVKFKESMAFSWKDARRGLDLALGDRLYTHNESMANVLFNNGPEIMMDPNTLLQIKQQGDDYGLQVDSGSVATRFNSDTEHITLILGQRKFIIRGKTKGTRLRISKTKETATVSVISGVAKIDEVTDKNTLKDSRKIKEAAIKLDAKEELKNIKVSRFEIIPERELSGSVAALPAREFPITWRYHNPKFNGKVELVVTTPFKERKTYQLNAKQTTFNLKPKIAGVYSYQIISKEGSSPLSTFTFRPYDPPSWDISGPRNKQGYGPTEEITIRLKARPYKMALRLINKRTSVVTDLDVKKSVILNKQEEKLDPGAYELLLTAQDYPSKGYTLTYPFIIEGTKKNGKEDGKEESQAEEIIKYTNVSIFPKKGTEVVLKRPNQLVDFKWRKVSQKELGPHETYIFEVAKDQDFSRDAIKRVTQSNFLKVPLAAAGTYYWRVKIKDELGNIKLGKPVEIKVSPAPPPKPLKLKENLKIKMVPKSTFKAPSFLLKNLTLYFFKAFIPSALAQNKKTKMIAPLTWPKEELAKSYILRIFKKDGPDSPLIEVEVEKNSYQWQNPKPGDYTWEVAIRDYWDRIGEASNRSNLTIEGPGGPLKDQKKDKGKFIAQPPIQYQLTTPRHQHTLKITRSPKGGFKPQEIEFSFEANTSRDVTFQMAFGLDFSRPHFQRTLKANSSRNSLSIPVDAILAGLKDKKRHSFYWRITDGKNHSYRRKITFLKTKTYQKKRPKKPLANQLATKKIKAPFGDNQRLSFFQEFTQTSFEQKNSLFRAEASGLFVHSLGVNLPLGNNVFFRGKIGTGKAFDDLRYNQADGALYYSLNNLKWTKEWLFSGGLGFFGQTSFEEVATTTLSERLDLNIVAKLMAQKPFVLFDQAAHAQLELSVGQAFFYRLHVMRSFGRLWHRDFDLGLFYEDLSYTADALEIERSSLGFLWRLAL